MNRVWVGLITVLFSAGLTITVGEASAQKKKKGASRAQAPTSAKIAESMGDLRWGMTKDELTKKFTGRVKAKYEPLIAKTKNPVEEDRLRGEEQNQLEAIGKSHVVFDGRTTGWDVSFLKGEFAHNTNEAMVVVRDSNSQNFYFFIDGKFWKWYKAFDASVFPADDFKAFQTAVERRFGTAKEMTSELRPGEGQRKWLEWQDAQSRLRAIDLTDFYGFYCLVFEQKATADQLAKLRGNQPKGSAGKGHALVESVTADRDGHHDGESDIADRISGRVREKSPEKAASGKRTAKPKPPPTAEPDIENDPLIGL